MTQTRDLLKKMADFFMGEEFFEKGEDARLEFSPDDVRCMYGIIKQKNYVPDINVGELIRRQAVLDLFAEKCDTVRPYHEVWQAVKELPSVELEKCGDCISRSSIIGKCEDTAKATSESGEINTGFIMALDFIADYAKHMPSVKPERKPGKWIWKDGNIPYCSNCKKYSNDADEQEIHGKVKFCSHCGSVMEEENVEI